MPRWRINLDGVTHLVDGTAMMGGTTLIRFDGEVAVKDEPASLDARLWRARSTVEHPLAVRGHRIVLRVRPTWRGPELRLVVDGLDAETGQPAAPPRQPPWTGGGAALPRPLLPADAELRPSPTGTTLAGQFRRAALTAGAFALLFAAVAAAEVVDNLTFAQSAVHTLGDLESKQRDGALQQVTYRYTIGDRTHRATHVVNDGYWQTTRAPSRVPLRYDARDAGRSRLDDAEDEWRFTRLGGAGLIVLLPVMLALLRAATRRDRTMRRAFAAGVEADGTVLGFDRLGERGPDGGFIWRLRYAYRDGSLRRHEATSAELSESAAARYGTGARGTVRHLADDPGASVWMG